MRREEEVERMRRREIMKMEKEDERDELKRSLFERMRMKEEVEMRRLNWDLVERLAEFERMKPKKCFDMEVCSEFTEEKIEEETDKTKTLDNIILQQNASGCFGALALYYLDIPESAKNLPEELSEDVDVELADDIWITLLVLAGLQDKYGDKRLEWNFLAIKSENWAREHLGAAFDKWKEAAISTYERFCH